jgi:hypothetical protein
MVLHRVMRSPMKAARTAMSTGFSFVPARRRSPETWGALEPAADGRRRWRRRLLGRQVAAACWRGESTSIASPPCRSGGSQTSRGGRVGRSADGRGNGRVHDERGAKRSGRVSAGIPQTEPTASARQETSEPRHRLTCGGCATLCDARSSPSSKVWSGQAAKNSKRAKLVGSP